MPIFVKDGVSVLFIHIPKTGGSSVELAMAESGWEMSMRSSPRLDVSGFRFHRVSPQHYHADLLRSTIRLGLIDVRFTVVRHPIQRFRSEYAMRRARKGTGAAAEVEEWAAGRFAAYARNPSVLDNHLRPQHEFLLDDTLVYKLEDGLENAVADLGRHGVQITAPVRPARDQARVVLPTSSVEISPALEARLREFYAEEFARFGYA